MMVHRHFIEHSNSKLKHLIQHPIESPYPRIVRREEVVLFLVGGMREKHAETLAILRDFQLIFCAWRRSHVFELILGFAGERRRQDVKPEPLLVLDQFVSVEIGLPLHVQENHHILFLDGIRIRELHNKLPHDSLFNVPCDIRLVPRGNGLVAADRDLPPHARSQNRQIGFQKGKFVLEGRLPHFWDNYRLMRTDVLRKIETRPSARRGEHVLLSFCIDPPDSSMPLRLSASL